MMILKIEVLVAILFCIEAVLEKYVIALKNPAAEKYPYLNKKEHAWSLVYAVALVIAITLISGWWWAFPSLLVSRRLFFDYPLKLVRQRPFDNIEGDGWFDKTARAIFGKHGGYEEASAVLILKFLLIAAQLYL
jgi:hypothetical protein